MHRHRPVSNAEVAPPHFSHFVLAKIFWGRGESPKSFVHSTLRQKVFPKYFLLLAYTVV